MEGGSEIPGKLLQRNQFTFPECVFQELDIAAAQFADRATANNLGLQVHFAQQGFIAGVGTKRIIIGEHMKRKIKN